MNQITEQIILLTEKLKVLSWSLSERQIKQFQIYLEELISWNQRTNLISPHDEAKIVTKHFFEALAILDVFDVPPNSYIIDIGTGAGLPGLPIKIVRPDLNMTLVDSKRMKTLFLKSVVAKMELSNIEIVNERAEVLNTQAEFDRRFDFTLARAVTNLRDLYLWSNPLLKSNGSLLALKGGDLTAELENLSSKIDKSQINVIPFQTRLIEEARDLVLVQIKK
jgi:16S rRNA (guanine527-N7)-methyltransferase